MSRDWEANLVDRFQPPGQTGSQELKRREGRLVVDVDR
jgi:hypothetical protein